MANSSVVVQMGHLTRDIDIMTTTSGVTIASFGLATNHKYKDKEEVCFIDVKIFGALAENCVKYLSKGSACQVIGRLSLDRWDKDGVKHQKHVIVASSVVFLSSKQGNNEDDQVPF